MNYKNNLSEFYSGCEGISEIRLPCRLKGYKNSLYVHPKQNEGRMSAERNPPHVLNGGGDIRWQD